MPPKAKISKQQILSAAMAIVRERGASALNARELAKSLGCSTQPIFSNYSSMEELKHDLIQAADELYQSYLEQDMESGAYPPYKASGMAYIRFAREEKELFKLLFMRDRTGEDISKGSDQAETFTALIQGNTGISKDDAYLFHLEMWIYVHGIATMLATSYLEWDYEIISRMLTDAYQGMCRHYTQKEEN